MAPLWLKANLMTQASPKRPLRPPFSPTREALAKGRRTPPCHHQSGLSTNGPGTAGPGQLLLGQGFGAPRPPGESRDRWWTIRVPSGSTRPVNAALGALPDPRSCFHRRFGRWDASPPISRSEAGQNLGHRAVPVADGNRHGSWRARCRRRKRPTGHPSGTRRSPAPPAHRALHVVTWTIG